MIVTWGSHKVNLVDVGISLIGLITIYAKLPESQLLHSELDSPDSVRILQTLAPKKLESPKDPKSKVKESCLNTSRLTKKSTVKESTAYASFVSN